MSLDSVKGTIPREAGADAPSSSLASKTTADPTVRTVRTMRTKHGRLAVELRVLGFHALLWTLAGGLMMAWVAALIGPDRLAHRPWSLPMAPILVGFVVHATLLFAALPSTRWVRSGSLVRMPRAWPLMLFGVAAAPFFLLAYWRNQRAVAARPPSTEDTEAAFRRLVAFPRVVATTFALTAIPALLAAVVILFLEIPLPQRELAPWTVLVTGTILPLVAVSLSRTQAMLRPEYLSAPRDPTRRIDSRRDLRVRLGVPAALVVVGSVAAPLAVAQIWQRTAARDTRAEAARALGDAILHEVAARDHTRIGTLLAENRGVSLRVSNSGYGAPRETFPTRTGLLDLDGDARLDAYVDHRNNNSVFVPVEGDDEPFAWLTVLCGVMIAFAGGLSVYVVADGVREDVRRSARQVRRVARGQVPDPLRVDSFHTLELRELVRSVDRLVARIAEANVAKYVVIEKAQEADRLRSQFLANMSHDLRSPLNSVLGFSELLLTGIDGQLGEEQAEMVSVIQSSGRFLLQQIDDILDTAKIDAGRMEVHPEPMPPATLMARAIKKARSRVHPDVEIRTRSGAGLPPAFADTYRAVQAVENVIVFASERLDSGVIETSVGAVKEAHSRYIEITVSTPKPPATKAQLEQVLEGFFRLPGHKGLGLGLPLAGSIVELHGGSLDVSEDDNGMRFEMRFPVPERRRRLRLDEGGAPPGSSSRS